MAISFRRFTKKFFVICNLVAALLFLLSCYNYLFNPQQFWMISLLALASFYFLLLLIGFIFFWLIAKPILSLISIGAMLLAWVPMKHLVKMRFTADFVLKKEAGSLRLMSWNVEHFKIAEHKTHPEKKQQMLALIKNYRPDVACFQEMVASDDNADAINYLPQFAHELQMPYYYYSYNKKLDFDREHHFGIVLFSKYPLINKKTISYSPNDYNSIFQYADVVKGADTIRLFNIHLQSMKFSNANRDYIEAPEMQNEKDIQQSLSVLSKLKKGLLRRKLQSERIKQEMNQSPYPVLLGGDFNDVPNSYAYKTIGRNMQNAFVQKGSGIGRTYVSMSPTLRIDNIFASDRFKVEQFVRIDKRLCDHYPIVADLYLKKE